MSDQINLNVNDTEEPMSNWKAVAGYAYVLICVFDFVVMPIATHVNKVDTKFTVIKIIEDHGLTAGLDVIDRTMNHSSITQWSPVTMSGGGLFHLSFGAILTGAAVTRGFERRELLKNAIGKKD